MTKMTTNIVRAALVLSASACMVQAQATEDWHMRPIKSLQARVESFAPIWDSDHKVWVSGIDSGNSKTNLTFEQRYAATLDSVTTSSVEGALMYLQRDCIDIGAEPTKSGCKRKNDVKVITFLEIEIANSNGALAEYQNDQYSYPEFCPFVEMKNGQCIFTNETATPTAVIENPAECKQYSGQNGQPNIGPCVGAEAFPTDNIAPYFDTVWFSYPGGCPMTTWASGKSASCRNKNPGGLCPFGVSPDGVKCSFAYKILGYINIDDLVGITSMDVKLPAKLPSGSSNSGSGSVAGEDDFDADADTDDGSSSSSSQAGEADGKSKCPSGDCFDDYEEFCQANRTEFHARDKDRTLGLRDVQAINFWGLPSDHRANKNRTAFMINMYNKLANVSTSNMTPLPLDLTKITKENPPCYQNSLACYNTRYGCVRHSYAQVCSVCKEMGEKCVVKMPAYTFPTLTKMPREVSDSELRSRKIKEPTEKASNPSSASRSSVGVAMVRVLVVVIFGLVW